MNKTLRKFFQTLLNPSGKWKLKKSKPKSQSKQTDVKYYDAKYFYNNLENENDYYLRISSCEENRFIKKNEIDNE